MSRPEPTTRSLTVLDTSTSPGAPSAPTRAPMLHRHPRDVIAQHLALAGVHAGTDLYPEGPAPSDDRLGASDARAGPSKVARKPSPVVLISGPRWRFSSLADQCVVALEQRPPAAVPQLGARSVDPTMSVNSTVSSLRSVLRLHAVSPSEMTRSRPEADRRRRRTGRGPRRAALRVAHRGCARRRSARPRPATGSLGGGGARGSAPSPPAVRRGCRSRPRAERRPSPSRDSRQDAGNGAHQRANAGSAATLGA